jgi:chromosome partitioning protein
MEVVELVRRRLNPVLRVARILPCIVDQRTRLTAEVLSEIRGHFGPLVARSMIRANVKLAEAPSFGHTIFQHAPDSNGAQDYLAFAAEYLGVDAAEPQTPNQAGAEEHAAEA